MTSEAKQLGAPPDQSATVTVAVETQVVPAMKGLLARGAFWIAVTRATGNLITFLSMLLLARFLVPADFGLIAIATTVSTIILSVTELSLASALVYHKNLSDEHFHSVFSLNLLRGVLIALLILALAAPVAKIYGDPRLFAVMAVISLSAVIGAASNPKLIIFSRQLIFWQEFVIGVSQKFIGFVVGLTVAIVFRSYWALVVSMLATQISGAILSYFLVAYRPKLGFSKVRDLLSFSVWLTLGQAINTLNWKFDHLVIGYLLGKVPLGYYTVGDNLALLPTREATMPLSQALFPGFAKIIDDLPRLRNAYVRAQSLLCAIAFPMGCGFALIARPFVELAMGSKWEGAVIVIQLLSSIFALQTMVYGLQPLAMAMGETKGLLQRDIVNLAVRFPLIIVGLTAGGLVGIIWARCASGLISIFVSMVMVRRLLGFSVMKQLMTNLRFILSVALMAVAAHLVDVGLAESSHAASLMYKLAAIVFCGAVVYVTALFAFWHLLGQPLGPEQEAIDYIRKIIQGRRAKRFPGNKETVA